MPHTSVLPRQIAFPATAEHGDPHFRLDQLLGAHLAPGYVGSVDLKTRVSEEQEFASDTCVRREGIDPETDARYLEELVFEVVYARSAALVGRGFMIPEETRERALATTDHGTLRRWLRLAGTASSLDELFGNESE